MTQTVRITVHPFELHSALDLLQNWSLSRHVDSPPYQGTGLIIDLNVVPDDKNVARKLTGDRFDLADTFWYLSDAERAERAGDSSADRILNQIREHGLKSPAATASESDILMRHVRAKAQEQLDV